MYTRINVEIPPKQQLDVTKDIGDFSRFSDKKNIWNKQPLLATGY